MMMALKSVAYAILILVSVHALPPKGRVEFHRDAQACFKSLRGEGNLGDWLNENSENYLVFEDCMLRTNEDMSRCHNQCERKRVSDPNEIVQPLYDSCMDRCIGVTK